MFDSQCHLAQAFDVAPAGLITGIITERGVISPQADSTGSLFFDVPGFVQENS
jgi:methylthioribose-1-phosphate isomerase